MHKPESVQNETHRILKDFYVRMDCLFPARKLDLVFINNKKSQVSAEG